MKSYIGSPGITVNGDPDPIETYLFTTKEKQMATNKKKARTAAEKRAAVAAGPEPTKRKTVLLRFARTLGATVLGVAATWAAGPDALQLVTDPTQQVVLLSVIVPLLTAAEKALRYGSEPGEDPEDSLL